jgi:hypothetical protein
MRKNKKTSAEIIFDLSLEHNTKNAITKTPATPVEQEKLENIISLNSGL